MKKEIIKKVLVTGGAGYIGSITSKQLLDAGNKVVVVDSLENGHREAVDPRALLEVANIGDIKAMEQILIRHKPEIVVDFAAYLAVGESMNDPEKYLRNNVINFISLLDAMVKVGVKKIIKSSTASVYGNPEKESDFPLREGYIDTCDPQSSALLPGVIAGKSVAGEHFLRNLLIYTTVIYPIDPSCD